jgi:hypothetical protein
MASEAFHVFRLVRCSMHYKTHFGMHCCMDESAIQFLAQKSQIHPFGVIKQFFIHMYGYPEWIEPLNIDPEYKRIFMEEHGVNIVLDVNVVQQCWANFVS